MDARSLPPALRLWSRFGAMAGRDRHERVGRALARRGLDAQTTYRSPSGFALRVDPEDYFQPLMLMGVFDPLVCAVVAQYARPGSVALDAGSHMGYIALHLARAVGPSGRVHCFEPDPRLVDRLRHHVAANDMGWVTVNHLAVSERSMQDVSLRLPDQVGWASLREEMWDAENAVRVDAVALDDYVRRERIDPQAISFIKLDVEGVEFEALRGLSETLRSSSASVLVEYIPGRIEGLGQDPEALLAFMAERGYQPWVPHREGGDRVTLSAGAAPEEGEDVLFRKA